MLMGTRTLKLLGTQRRENGVHQRVLGHQAIKFKLRFIGVCYGATAAAIRSRCH